LPSSLALQISSSVYSTSARSTPRPSVSRDSILLPDHIPDTYRSHVRDSQSSSVRVSYIPHLGPSTPALAVSKSSCVFRNLHVLSHRVPIHSHTFGSPRHRPPLRSISRCLRQSPPRTRRRQAISATCPASAPAPLYRTFTDPSSLRSLVPFSSAPRTPRGFARTALGTTATTTVHRSRPTPFDHVPSRGPIRTSTTPLRILPRSRRELEKAMDWRRERCGASILGSGLGGVGQIGLRHAIDRIRPGRQQKK